MSKKPNSYRIVYLVGKNVTNGKLVWFETAKGDDFKTLPPMAYDEAKQHLEALGQPYFIKRTRIYG